MPDYRLAPEHPFPAALDDTLACYDWLIEQGITPQNIVVAGDTVGSGLTLSLMLKLHEANRPLPSAAVLI